MKKKTKTLLALFAALSMSVMFGSLVGCGGDGHTHVDADENGFCDECNEPIGGATTPDPEAPKSYDVTFETGGGTAIPAQGVEEGGKATKPGDPKRYGFIFDGWYTDGTFETEFNFDRAITADTTVHAKWKDAAATAESYFTFTDVDGGVKIAVKTGQTLPADTVLPREYNSKAVVEIAEQAFEGQAQLTAVKIPESVKKIGTQAFRNCTKLEVVTGGENVEEIGANAFYGSAWDLSLPVGEVYLGKTLYKYAGSLYDDTVITVKEGTVGIAAGAFRDLEKLTGIVLPNGLKNIGSYALGGTGKGTSLTSVVLPDSVEYVAENAFRNNKKLREVTFGKGLKEIGSNAFAGTALEKVNYNATNATLSVAPFSGLETPAELVIGDELTGIPTNLTKNWPGLQKVHFGKNITTLSESMFDGAAGITEITLPEKLTTIGNYALRGTGIRELTIPASVTSIGAYAFANCTELGKVQYNAKNATGTSEEGLAFAGCTALDSVTFGYEVEKIPAYLFKDSGIYSMDLGVNVKEIGDAAFAGTNLTTVDLKNVTTVGNEAFSQCKLYMLELRSVEKIGDAAFAGNRLVGLHIPESVAEIGRRAFSSSRTLTDVFFYAESAVQIYDDEMDRMFYNTPNIESLYIGSSVKNIPAYFMYNNTNITSVPLPSTYGKEYYIGEYAFYGCSSLENVTAVSYIVTTGRSAFDGTPWITSYVDKQTSEFVFVGSTLYRWNPKKMPAYDRDGVAEDQLLSITIPAKTTFINDNCFTSAIADWYSPWASAYTEWYNNGRRSGGAFPMELRVPIKEVLFEEGCELEGIGTYAFRGFALMRSITLPETVKEIGPYAFANCLGLEEVNFGEHPSLEKIDTAAFRQCISLRDLKLPATLKSLGGSSLYGVGGKIVIPESCTDIAKNVFAPEPTANDGGYNYGIFANLEELVIEAPIEKVPDNLCAYQSNLTKVTLPDTVTEIGQWAFANTGITSIDLSNVTKMGKYVFQWKNGGGSTLNNTCLTEVILNPDIEDIAEGAFTQCVNLTGDFVFNKLEILNKDVFKNCAKINSLTFKALTTESSGLAGCNGLTSLDFGPKLTTLKSAISSTVLKVLHLPATLTQIPSLFTGTTGPVFVYLDGMVDPQTIPKDTFKGVSYVVVEDDLYDTYTAEGSKWIADTKVAKDKFIKASDVKVQDGFYFVSDAYVKYFAGDRENVTLPATVDSITTVLDIFGTADAYAACKSFALADGHTNLKLTNGMLTNADGTTLYAYFGGDGADLTKVTTIADYAFYNKVTAELAAKFAPSKFTALTSIGQYAFADCSLDAGELTKALAKEGLSIGNFAFRGVAVETLTIDETVKATLAASALSGVTAGKAVLKTGTSTYGVTTTVVELNVAEVTSSMIGSSTKTLILGESVTSIAKNAIRMNSNLETVEFKGQTPPTISVVGKTDNFYSCNNLKAVIVPTGTVEAYKAKLGTAATDISGKNLVSALVVTVDLDDETWTVYSGKIVAYKGDYTTVEIPKEVTSMETILDIFGTAENLAKCTKLTVNAGNTAFKFENNLLTSKDGAVLYYNMGEAEKLTFTGTIKPNSLGKATSFELTVPNTVTTIESILDLVGSPEYILKCTKFTLAGENEGLKFENNQLTNADGTVLYWYNGNAKTLDLSGKKNEDGESWDVPSITKIGAYAFYYRSTLEKLTLGESVTEIGEGAFIRCAYKFELTLNTATKAPTLGANAFGAANLEFSGKIYVPKTSIYMSGTWSKYKSFIKTIPTT